MSSKRCVKLAEPILAITTSQRIAAFDFGFCTYRSPLQIVSTTVLYLVFWTLVSVKSCSTCGSVPSCYLRFDLYFSMSCSSSSLIAALPCTPHCSLNAVWAEVWYCPLYIRDGVLY